MASRESSQQRHEETAHPPQPRYEGIDTDAIEEELTDEFLDVEYDSSELLDDDLLFHEVESAAKDSDSGTEHQVVREKEQEAEDEEEDLETIDVLSAFGLTPGLSSLPGRNEESGKEVEAHHVEPEVVPSISRAPSPTWENYPQLLAPRTPPGKRVIITEDHPPANPKAVDNHRVSYGLTAASVYARLQPSLRQRNGTNGTRQKVVPRPYKKRPVTVTSTTELSAERPANPAPKEDSDQLEIDSDLMTDHQIVMDDEQVDQLDEFDSQDFAEGEEEEEEKHLEDNHDEEELFVEEQTEQNVLRANHTFHVIDKEKDRLLDQPQESLHEQEEQDDQLEEQEEKDEEKEENSQNVARPSPAISQISTTENETLKQKESTSADGPVDIKSLLRNAGPLSLSEILQQKGMSLADLLKGGGKIAPVIGTITTVQPSISKEQSTTPITTTTTTTTKPITTTKKTVTTTKKTVTTASLLDVIPTVKPISLRELLAAKNMSLQEIIQPSVETSTTDKNPTTKVAPTLKPGVKLPVPFNVGRAKGLAGLVAPSTARPEGEGSTTESSVPSSPPNQTVARKPPSDLTPMIFGGSRSAIEEATTTPEPMKMSTHKSIVIQSKRPYVASMNVGEYGTHLGRSFDEDEEENNGTGSISSNSIGSYGNQRPIATSRLTPPPPRKQRPVLNFNYNALSEEDEEGDETEATTLKPILTHFREEELIEDHPYFDLPVSVRNAIIVSSSIGGFCLLVFIVILIVFRIRQKTRIRLRHPAALLGLGGVIDTTGSNGSDSSGITTPVSHAASKSGYAKLPRRSSSLWGTLRRSVRQMETMHYS